MHTRRAISAELTRLAELQAGVVTAEQAVALGQSRHSVARLLDSGQWFRLATGLYRTVPVAVDFVGLAWGGVLLGGDSARLGPRASGFLHHHPCAVAGQVWAMLAERGRSEPFQHCPRCLKTPLAELIRG